jgi:16S rRNA (uracil1498-N3)-methyltransferase
MHRFFIPELTLEQTTYTLSEDESKHACKVLRMNTGDYLEIINGKGTLFTAVISDAHHKHCSIEITSLFSEKPSSTSIHIAIAPTKNMDRLEWFIEKATEIGVTEITPILCSNSERKVLKLERLEKIIVSATKQSQRLFIPQLNELTPIATFIQQHPNCYIAHCEVNQPRIELHTLKLDSNFTLIIGPEGDFSSTEIELAMKNKFKAVSLGSNRLRTETAGVYAVTIAKSRLS